MILKKLSKVALTCIFAFTFFTVALFGVKKFRSHAPLEKAGTCILFDLNFGEPGEKTELAPGQIVENNVVAGEAIVIIYFKGYALIKVEVPYESLRKKGYIKVNCNEIF